MRLICPNCGAQYQIDADVIPDGGRDVQCSNCGHTWFERPGASEAAEEGFGAMETPAEPEDVAPTPPPPAPAATVDDEYFEDTAAAADEPAGLTRKPLDSSVADILKEEADRENAARAAETVTAPAIETQQEMPVDPPAAKIMPPEVEPPFFDDATPDIEPPAVDTAAQDEETRSRIARLRGDETNAAAAAAVVASSRKESLPDIEEINSTLRSSAERGEVTAPMPEQVEKTKKRGFRFGFILGLLLIVALVLLYIFADQIIAAVPALDGAISSYVTMVDNLRLWLDGLIRGATDSMELPASDAGN